jgi:hypothetical protein
MRAMLKGLVLATLLMSCPGCSSIGDLVESRWNNRWKPELQARWEGDWKPQLKRDAADFVARESASLKRDLNDRLKDEVARIEAIPVDERSSWDKWLLLFASGGAGFTMLKSGARVIEDHAAEKAKNGGHA